MLKLFVNLTLKGINENIGGGGSISSGLYAKGTQQEPAGASEHGV